MDNSDAWEGRRSVSFPLGADHVNNSRTPPVIVRRYPASLLCDIVYGIAPMTTELAETIRTLRRDYAVDYAAFGCYLCETNPTWLA